MALAVHRTGVIFKKCDMSNHRPDTVKQCVSGTCQHTCPSDTAEKREHAWTLRYWVNGKQPEKSFKDDPWIGRRVPELFRRAGLEGVGVEARVQMYPPGNSRRTSRLDLVRSMRPQVLEMGLATAGELDELDAAARAHLDHPHTVVMSGLLFLTWGRKPDHAPGDSRPGS